jgi:hypothetical protein
MRAGTDIEKEWPVTSQHRRHTVTLLLVYASISMVFVSLPCATVSGRFGANLINYVNCRRHHGKLPR